MTTALRSWRPLHRTRGRSFDDRIGAEYERRRDGQAIGMVVMAPFAACAVSVPNPAIHVRSAWNELHGQLW